MTFEEPTTKRQLSRLRIEPLMSFSSNDSSTSTVRSLNARFRALKHAFSRNVDVNATPVQSARTDLPKLLPNRLLPGCARCISRLTCWQFKRKNVPELNLDVLREILLFLNLEDLNSCRATCHIVRCVGESILRSRSRAIAMPFFDDVHRWENMMRRWSVVYTGYRALACVVGDPPHRNPLILDVSVGKTHAFELEAFLVNSEGFHWDHVPVVHFEPRDDTETLGLGRRAGYSINTGHGRTVTLCKHEPVYCRIQIHVTRTPFSLSGLPYAWSTLFMTAVSPDHIYCAYPALTLYRTGLISSQYLRRNAEITLAANLSADMAHYGYIHSTELVSDMVRRTRRVPTLSWKHHPVVVRSMRDNGVMVVNFATCPTISNDGLKILGRRHSVFWQLGGLEKLRRGDTPFGVWFSCTTQWYRNFVM